MTDQSIKDKLSICETCKFVLRIGLFFDGTGNNSYNVSTRISGGELPGIDSMPLTSNSYKADYTNVWKLHRLYPTSHSQRNVEGETYIYGNFYIEGIGTDTGYIDSPYGQVSGSGDYGVIAKSAKGASQAWEFVRAYASYNITRIEVDVFGFSRGAAAARHYAHVLNLFQAIYGPYYKTQKGWRRNMTKTKENMDGLKRQVMSLKVRGEKSLYSVFHEIPTNIQFIGLFDTVPSIISPKYFDLSATNKDHGSVLLHLSPGIAKEKVVQLAAINERRENFALKSILSNPVSCEVPELKTEGNHLEECLYGSHSDIGGGYLSGSTEVDLGTHPDAVEHAINEGRIGSVDDPHCQTTTVYRSAQVKECIYEGENGRITQKLVNDEIFDTTMQRDYVDGSLSKIALHKMHDYAVSSSVPLVPIQHRDETSTSTEPSSKPILGITDIPPELQLIDEKTHNNTPLSAEELKLLDKKYIHNSDSYSLGQAPTENRKRVISAN
ncbi:hypothetical protein PsAD2_03981 [Pseudovibrio axinellae]|uniref:T6SS Phospholipase effector Tle1-like catalytic domain-containing protein n=1 Tax=Pseudovibrio axinellae TaxID=989403 RepID=A0A165UJZ3_9HYPH|nr:DUF2235 domain-containing protein [Pseudovibrio axinellae]KZL11832.1 hypothetical protein PsAD2_03981 [Pseudovibrio axinellae]SER92178.1 type VI secretion system secreted protein VgrG [Pseudovibrio axinellae]